MNSTGIVIPDCRSRSSVDDDLCFVRSTAYGRRALASTTELRLRYAVTAS